MGVVRFGPKGSGSSIHVYVGNEPTLTRGGLVSLMRERGWEIQIIDPGDFRPLDEGLIVEDWIVGSKNQKDLARAVGMLRTSGKGALKSLGKKGDIARCEVFVSHPFDATEVLGALEPLTATFGTAGVEVLRKAKTLYAVNAPANAGSQTVLLLRDLSDGIARHERGVLKDFEGGEFRQM